MLELNLMSFEVSVLCCGEAIRERESDGVLFNQNNFIQFQFQPTHNLQMKILLIARMRKDRVSCRSFCMLRFHW